MTQESQSYPSSDDQQPQFELLMGGAEQRISKEMDAYTAFGNYCAEQALEVHDAPTLEMTVAAHTFIYDTVERTNKRREAQMEEPWPLIARGQVMKALSHYFTDIKRPQDTDPIHLRKAEAYLGQHYEAAHKMRGSFPEIRLAETLLHVSQLLSDTPKEELFRTLHAAYGRRFEELYPSTRSGKYLVRSMVRHGPETRLTAQTPDNPTGYDDDYNY